jgi:hypothetical protein
MVDSPVKAGLEYRGNGIAEQQPASDVEENTHDPSLTREYVRERALSIPGDPDRDA